MHDLGNISAAEAKVQQAIFCLGFLIALESYIENFEGLWELKKE